MHDDGRPRWRAVVLSVAFALLAAACGGGGGGAGGQAGGEACPEGGVALAFFGPLTGPNSPQLGINIRDGAQLAINQYMEGDPACPVELVQFDSQGDPAQAPALAQQAATNERIIAVIGPTYSGESEVAVPIFNEAGLPIISASATQTGLSSNGWEVFHRAVATDDQQGPALAQYIRETLGATKVAVIDDRSAYGLPLANTVRSELGDLVVHNDSIDTAAQDYSSTVNGVRAAGADAIFFGGYYQQAGLLLKQLRDAGVTATFLSGDGSRDELLIPIAGAPAAQGALLSCPCAPNDQLQGGGAFVNSYSDTYGNPPGIYAPEGFDVANMFLEAITEGRTDRPAINEWLNTASYQGVSKTLEFQENGDISGGRIYLYEVEGEQLVGVGPIG